MNKQYIKESSDDEDDKKARDFLEEINVNTAYMESFLLHTVLVMTI